MSSPLDTDFVELDHLAGLIRRPAVRRFDPTRDVPHALVVHLVDAARWTGSARNRQPWRLVEVRDRDTLQALSQLGAFARFVADAPVVLAVATADDGFADTACDSGRMMQSLILAAATVGLAACPATIYPRNNVDTAGRLLGLAASWRPHHLLALGHPGSVEPWGISAVPAGRRPTSELLTTFRREPDESP